jgi:hypothetical protein
MALSAPTQAGLYWARKRRRAPFAHIDNATGHYANFLRRPSINETWTFEIAVDRAGVPAHYVVPFSVLITDTPAGIATKAVAAVTAAAIPNVGALATGSVFQLLVSAPAVLRRWNITGDEGYTIIGSDIPSACSATSPT